MAPVCEKTVWSYKYNINQIWKCSMTEKAFGTPFSLEILALKIIHPAISQYLIQENVDIFSINEKNCESFPGFDVLKQCIPPSSFALFLHTLMSCKLHFKYVEKTVTYHKTQTYLRATSFQDLEPKIHICLKPKCRIKFGF